MTDPLMSHLLDIVASPAAKDLILAGGFGIRIKQSHLQKTQARTLMAFPQARATQDLDFFLRLSLFVQKERGKAVRALLDGLDYQEHTPKWQFSKPFNPLHPQAQVMVDLMARSPEDKTVQVKKPRVGSGSGIELHGKETPEAFAVEESPIQVPVEGVNSAGARVQAKVYVPHPYAWLNMKIKASFDWLKQTRQEIPPKEDRSKHVFDVYVLMAMLTEAELGEASEFAQRFREHAMAKEIRQNALELFGSDTAPGVLEIQRQSNEAIDIQLFREVLGQVLGA